MCVCGGWWWWCVGWGGVVWCGVVWCGVGSVGGWTHIHWLGGGSHLWSFRRPRGFHVFNAALLFINLLNKANLRYLIAATGQVILLKLDSNRQFFARVTLKFDGWPWKIIRHVFYKSSFCVSFQIHQEIQTEDTVQNRPIWVKIDDFFSRVTFEFDVWPWKTIGHLFYSTSSFVHHFVAIGEFKLELQSGKPHLGDIWQFLEPCDLEIWRMTLKNTRAHLLCYFKLCALFRSHQWFQTGDTVWKRPIWVKIEYF